MFALGPLFAETIHIVEMPLVDGKREVFERLISALLLLHRDHVHQDISSFC